MAIHNGFELSKWFEVEIPPTNNYIYILSEVLFQLNRVLRKIKLPLLGISDDHHLDDSKILHEGWYQDKKYFEKVGGPRFIDNIDLGDDNRKILDDILSSNSVSVHIRRGDFLLPKNVKTVGGICTPEYYVKSIKKICQFIPDAKFFFFSDDPEYVINTYKELNKVVVSCNKGERSFYDIYLMSHCKNMILANSTFSCWAAYLNQSANVVICPPKWNHKENPDLSLKKWIVVDSI